MKSNKLILTLVVTIAFTAFSYGQKRGKMNRQVEITELKEELNLSEEQTHQLMEARTASSAKMKVLRADEKLTKEEKRKVAKDIRKEHKQEVDAVLTKEQKAKSKEMNKRKRAEHKEERKAKSEEMKAYRAEFDTKISAQDKAELKRLKTVLNEGKGKGRNAKSDKEEKVAFEEAHKAEFESLDALAAKYEGEISTFLDTKGVKENHKRKGKAKAMAKVKRKSKKKAMKRGHNNKAARFLLMDQGK